MYFVCNRVENSESVPITRKTAFMRASQTSSVAKVAEVCSREKKATNKEMSYVLEKYYKYFLITYSRSDAKKVGISTGIEHRENDLTSQANEKGVCLREPHTSRPNTDTTRCLAEAVALSLPIHMQLVCSALALSTPTPTGNLNKFLIRLFYSINSFGKISKQNINKCIKC